MESQGELGTIQVSRNQPMSCFARHISSASEAVSRSKAVGTMTTYFMLGRKTGGATDHYQAWRHLNPAQDR
jgi:hypothetical protein